MADPLDRDEFVSPGPVRKQVRKRRKDGWTRRDMGVFLSHYRVTGNLTGSAAAAGKQVRGVYRLRATDPGFAADMKAALEESIMRIESKAIVYAETQGRYLPPAEDGEPVEAPQDMFEPNFALKLLAHFRDRREGRQPRGGPRRRSASKEDFVQAAMKLLGMMERRPAKRA